MYHQKLHIQALKRSRYGDNFMKNKSFQANHHRASRELKREQWLLAFWKDLQRAPSLCKGSTIKSKRWLWCLYYYYYWAELSLRACAPERDIRLRKWVSGV
jgi:hypothetical protein